MNKIKRTGWTPGSFFYGYYPHDKKCPLALRESVFYCRGAPMCAPVIHGTGFIPLSSPAVRQLPLHKGALLSGKAFLFVGADTICTVFDWTGLTIPQSHLRCDSSLYTREPCYPERLFAADRCFYTAKYFIMIKRKSAVLCGFWKIFCYFAKYFLFIFCIIFVFRF